MSKQLAFIELMQETNSFSSLTTGMREFQQFALHMGSDLHAFSRKHQTQGLGFLQALEKFGQGEFRMLPVFSAWAWSGGPIELHVYEHFRDLAVKTLSESDDLCGVYLSLHGAMGVVGIRDPESDLMQAIRIVVGAAIPVVVSFDLHANVTARNAELADVILGYRTNPHRDFRKVGFKAGQILLQMARGEVKPVMAFRKMRLLKGGGMGLDFLQPMRGILGRMRQMERIPGVLATANFWVHIWMDDVELGWSVTVTTDNDPELAERLADELCDKNWTARTHGHPQPITVEEAIRKARGARILRRLGTLTFCDVSDIVGAGAPGANTNILRALLEQAPDLVSYVPVRDPVAVGKLFDAEQDEVEVNVGGCIDPQLNPTVKVKGTILSRCESQWGKTIILKSNGVHLILTELPFPAYFASDFKQLGLNLWRADITVVKNLFPYRFRMLKYNRRSFLVVTQGITHLDVHKLPYKTVPRPIYPLDSITDWR
jgi:microcystin degradation protein MlrC